MGQHIDIIAIYCRQWCHRTFPGQTDTRCYSYLIQFEFFNTHIDLIFLNNKKLLFLYLSNHSRFHLDKYLTGRTCRVYSVSRKKIPPPWSFLAFFPNCWELVQILHTYCTFLSMLDYKFLSNYLLFWRSYAILSATTQFTAYVQNVHHRPKRTLAFSEIFFSNRWKFLVTILQTYYSFLSTLQYKFLSNYL